MGVVAESIGRRGSVGGERECGAATGRGGGGEGLSGKMVVSAGRKGGDRM